jgi:trimethylamine:corrinoid methyltransferase-like protein
LRDEHYFPGPVINRANRSRWQDEGSSTLEDRAQKEVKELLRNYEPSSLSNEIKKELINLMEHEAGKFNQKTLPMRDE